MPSETDTASRSKRITTFISRRWRCSLRAFLLSVAALYFFAMYTFHTNLDERNQRPNQPAEYPVGGHLVPKVMVLETRITLNVPQQQGDFAMNEANALNAQMILAQEKRTKKEETFFHLIDLYKINNSNIAKNLSVNSLREEPRGLFRTGTFQSDRNIPVNCRNLPEIVDLKPDRFVQIAADVRLYSAYWDERPNDFDNLHNGSYIRFMAIVTNKASPKLECIFSTTNKQYVNTPVKYYEMCENHNRPYGGFIISCSVPEEVREPPCAINVTFNGVNVALLLRTLKPIDPPEDRRNFTVCVPPLFGDITRARLVEFIEVTTVLGADHVMFYVFNVPGDVQELLDKYTAIDGGRRVSVISWPLEAQVDSAMWYHGQSVAIQDCLYRNMATSTYVAFNDIDEYIVPHRVMFWSEMTRELDQPSECAFQFQSSFLDANFVNSTFIEEVGLSLDTLTVLQRSTTFNKMRAKCMVKPYLIFEKGIHHISKPIWANLAVTRVDPDVAYLHHYRPCTVRMGGNCFGQTPDHSMLRYKQPVIDGLLAVRTRLVHS